MQIALLAERLRVEERLLIDAFAGRGHEAVLLSPERVQVPLGGLDAGLPELVLDRGIATAERSILATLLAAGGTTVVNRAATARLLSDRLALLRHLIIAGIPVPETVVSFGEEATFAAIEALGYPVLLKSLTVNPGVPVALVEDQDAAEAIVEHRTMLGGERAVLIQRFIAGASQSIRLVIVGRELVGIETRQHDGWRPGSRTNYEPYPGANAALTQLAERVVARLGRGTHAIEVIEGPDGPVVVGVGNLVDFRSIAGREIDIAGAIADFALAQYGEKDHGG
jgi:[lysine-biosynthesis-protein LysW]--L-2-aminoadipate ligase